jgi:hypothetical protein
VLKLDKPHQDGGHERLPPQPSYVCVNDSEDMNDKFSDSSSQDVTEINIMNQKVKFWKVLGGK